MDDRFTEGRAGTQSDVVVPAHPLTTDRIDSALRQRFAPSRPQRRASPAERRVSREYTHRRALLIADLLAFLAALSIAFYAVGDDRPLWPVLLCIPLFVLMAKMTGLYDRDELLLRRTTLEEVPRLFAIASVATLVFWWGEASFVGGALGKPQVFLLWSTLAVVLPLLRLVARRVVSRVAPVERCLVVGDAAVLERLRGKLAGERHIKLVGSIPLDQVARRLPELRRITNDREADRLIVAPPRDGTHEETLNLIRGARATGLAVSIMPGLLEVIGSAVEFDHVQGITLMGVKRFGLSRSSQALKRGFDLVGAAICVIATVPVLAVVALAIKLDARGGCVLFRQERVGRDGRSFQMVKFRTMVDGADALRASLADRNEACDGLFKIADDPRVTRVGRILRKTSLDELPQLLNVLRGEMSLVGPRPLVVDEDERVTGHDRRRLLLTPGMTGPWQIAGSARVPLADMVRMDYVYVASWSLWSDVLILLRTVPYVLARRGQ